MTISQDLTYVILALDSYNRGYGEGVTGLDGLGSDIANYTIIDQSDTEDGSAGVAASFYAAAYQDASGTIVISYRGTDDPSGDAFTGWTTGGGAYDSAQAKLAAEVHSKVREACPTNGRVRARTHHRLCRPARGLPQRPARASTQGPLRASTNPTGRHVEGELHGRPGFRWRAGACGGQLATLALLMVGTIGAT